MNRLETEVLVIGGGLAGLAAASVLGERAVVVEANERPGGLCRTENVDGFWFDHCVHLLYFDHAETEARVRALLGDHLARCPPLAWVDTSAGRARFPIQANLEGLELETRVACLRDLARACYAEGGGTPAHFQEMLARSFGAALCELFFYPYNRKMWKRPLDALAPSGFQWNIVRPDYEAVLRGALVRTPEEHAYNANGWYPRPPPGAPWRGIEVLVRALAARAHRLLTGHRVVSLDPARREATIARADGTSLTIHYRHACCASGPLPSLIASCTDMDDAVLHDARTLKWNRVRSVAWGIRGARPEGTGHWRYYPDERLVFTRLVFPQAFDPHTAPDGTWSLLAEITERAEASGEDVAARARDDARAAGVLRPSDEIVVERVFDLEPAYVVFEPGAEAIVQRLKQALIDRGVHPIGRYARWEYSSMAQVLRDGFTWGEQVARDLEGLSSGDFQHRVRA